MDLLNRDYLPPRDIDLVAILNFEPDLSLRDRYRDLRYDVEETALEEYFLTRDFTINELLADKHYLYATPDALKDFINRVIRPSAYEKGWQGGEIKNKLVMKALRLLSEFELLYNEGKIEDIKDWCLRLENVSLFTLALSLDKACQMGNRVAGRFLFKLIELGIAEVEGGRARVLSGESVRDLAVDIITRMIDEGDYFIFSHPELKRATESLLRQIGIDTDGMGYKDF